MDALRAFLFGVTIAAPVGPIALLLIHTGLNHRLAAALAGALGVALADFTYALVALSAGTGLSALLHSHQPEFQFTSSGLLILLGLWLATKAMRQPVPKAGAKQQATRPPGLVQLYLLTLANPLTILLFAGFSGQMTAGGSAGAILNGSVFLFVGSLAIQAAYATFGAVLQRWATTPGAVRTVNALSGVGIAGFGLYGLWSAG